MAKIETLINRQLDLTVHTVSGDLTTKEILDKLESYYQGRPTKQILWDLSNATWSSITSADLEKTVKTAKKYSRKGGKTAFVFSKDVDYGIGRMLEVFGEFAEYDYEFRSFRSMEDARKWLGTPDQTVHKSLF